jgi:hypothetical protein
LDWGLGFEVSGLGSLVWGARSRVLGVECSGVTLNVARPDMNNYATLGVMLYLGIGGSKDFALRDLARRATLGLVLYWGYAI